MNFKSLISLLLLVQADAYANNIMEEVVVIGTRSDKTLQQNPYAISLITNEMIEKNTHSQLADLLSLTPGITISDAGQAGQKRIRIRGEEARRMALLVDGQEFGDHREVGVPLLVDITRIQKIEIIRGPASVLYGPKAMGGVINVITKPESGTVLDSTISATYDTATQGQIISANFHGKLPTYTGKNNEDFTWNFGAFDNDQGLRTTPDGEVENTAFESHGYHGNLQYTIGQHNLGLGYEKYISASEIYVEPEIRFAPPFLDFAIDSPVRDREKVRLDYEYVNFDSNAVLSAIKVDAYQQNSDREFNTSFTLRLAPTLLNDTAIDTTSDLLSRGLNIQSDWDISENGSLVAGIQWVADEINQDRVRSVAINGGTARLETSFDEAELTTTALYVQGDFELNDSLNLLAGFRSYHIDGQLSDSNRSTLEQDYKDQHTIASVALVYNLSDASTFRLNASQGYIYPSLLNLAMGAFAGSRYINPDQTLEPETSLTYELGYRFKAPNVSFDVTAFATSAEDYIDHVSCLSGDDCLTSRDKIYKNIGDADTHGLELAASYDLEAWEFYSQLTWLKRNKNYEGVDTWDSGVPEITGQIGARYAAKLFSRPLNLAILSRFEGHTKETVATRRGFSTEENPGYFVMDAELSYFWNDQTSLHFSAANLGNKTYHSASENLDAAERHYRLKVNRNF